MSDNKSGVSFALDTRVNFLHKLKNIARRNQSDIEEKRVTILGLCQLLYTQGLDLSCSKNEMPDSESRVLRVMFISDTYNAANIRHDFEKDLEDPELHVYRDMLIQEAYDEIREIVNRAVVRYERMINIINKTESEKIINS